MILFSKNLEMNDSLNTQIANEREQKEDNFKTI